MGLLPNIPPVVELPNALFDVLLVPNNPPPVEVPGLLAVDPNALPPPKDVALPPPNAPKPVAGFGALPNNDPDVAALLLAFENAPGVAS